MTVEIMLSHSKQTPQQLLAAKDRKSPLPALHDDITAGTISSGLPVSSPIYNDLGSCMLHLSTVQDGEMIRMSGEPRSDLSSLQKPNGRERLE